MPNQSLTLTDKTVKKAETFILTDDSPDVLAVSSEATNLDLLNQIKLMKAQLVAVQNQNKLLEEKNNIEKSINIANLKALELKTNVSQPNLKRNINALSIDESATLQKKKSGFANIISPSAAKHQNIENLTNNTYNSMHEENLVNKVINKLAFQGRPQSTTTLEENIVNSIINRLASPDNPPNSNLNSCCSNSKQCCGIDNGYNCNQQCRKSSGSSDKKTAGLLALIGFLSGME